MGRAAAVFPAWARVLFDTFLFLLGFYLGFVFIRNLFFCMK